MDWGRRLRISPVSRSSPCPPCSPWFTIRIQTTGNTGRELNGMWLLTGLPDRNPIRADPPNPPAADKSAFIRVPIFSELRVQRPGFAHGFAAAGVGGVVVDERLGRCDEALNCYNEGVRWMQQSVWEQTLLIPLRNEANSALQSSSSTDAAHEHAASL